MLYYGPMKAPFDVVYDEERDALICIEESCYFIVDYDTGTISKHDL